MTAKATIIPINWIDRTERFAVIRGYDRRRRKPLLKEFYRNKGSCHFTRGVPTGLIDFSYRAVIKLGLKGKRFFFSRGAVKRNGISLVHTVALQQLDWDAGISVIIPQKLRYSHRFSLSINGTVHDLRVMEIAVLMALLSLKAGKRSKQWYADMAASVIAAGWRCLDGGRPLPVSRPSGQEGSRGDTKNIRTRAAKKPAKKPIP